MAEVAFIGSRLLVAATCSPRDDVQGHVGAPPDARQAGLEDRGAPGADGVDDLLGRSATMSLRAGGEGHDGVGSAPRR